ncbi:MAG: hypothetical protein LBV20_04930 [Treponema sp.]|jgi:hypothetical protein|nr:hypothetical protein [Treponema sp.]
MKRYVLIAFCIVVMFSAEVPLKALESVQWLARGGMIFFPENNGLESDPSPLLATAGAATQLSFFDFLALEISLDFYGTHYGYSNTLNRAVPLAIENRSAMVYGSVLGIQAVLMLKPLDSWTIRMYAGPAIDARLSLIAGGLNDADLADAADQTSKVSSYFWNMGRWFYPTAGIGMDFTAFDNVLLGFDLRTWFPVYKLWTNENLPPINGWRFGAGFTITFL